MKIPSFLKASSGYLAVSLLVLGFVFSIQPQAVAQNTSNPNMPLVLEGDEKKKDVPDVDPVFFRDVAYELRCPTCVGLSVLESSASFSEQIKAQVKEQIAAGKDKEAILEFFVERYGPWILREPPKEGFNLVGWILPTILLAFGPIVVWLTVWRRRKDINTYGVRSVESVIQEMNDELKSMRKT